MRAHLPRGLSPVFIGTILGLVLMSCSSVPTFRMADLPPSVQVEDRGQTLVVLPRSVPAKPVGLLFYPGGLVKPEAYLPALVPLAEKGYPVLVVRMPFDLAFFDSEKGLGFTGSVPGVGRWVIAGHSLGGVAAAMAVDKHPEAFAGLVFWASYPATGNDLSRRKLPVLSVSATNDGLSTPAKVEAAAALLPASTERVVILGGNHGQFGTYGPQKGDGVATIGREAQQALVAKATEGFLDRIVAAP
jgi:dienelactone hydrolase